MILLIYHSNFTIYGTILPKWNDSDTKKTIKSIDIKGFKPYQSKNSPNGTLTPQVER